MTIPSARAQLLLLHLAVTQVEMLVLLHVGGSPFLPHVEQRSSCLAAWRLAEALPGRIPRRPLFPLKAHSQLWSLKVFILLYSD